jgi:hypothetical protein
MSNTHNSQLYYRIQYVHLHLYGGNITTRKFTRAKIKYIKIKQWNRPSVSVKAISANLGTPP